MNELTEAYFKIGFEEGKQFEHLKNKLVWDALKEGIDGMILTYDEDNIDDYQEGKLRQALETRQFIDQIESCMENFNDNDKS